MKRINLLLNITHSRPSNVEDCIKSANEAVGQGDEQWRLLWRDSMKKTHLEAIDQLVQSLQPCKNLLVLGIGGSALGSRALHAALAKKDSPFCFVLDNIDSDTFQKTIDQIKSNDSTLSQTVVVVVSKSGETSEVAALYMATQKALPQATYVAITGEQGSLRELATDKGWATLPIPEGVGGRFSVLSAVGLFPAAMCGIDIHELLEGAKEMDDRCMQLSDNPAADLASGLVAAMKGGRNIHVMMPYCDRLSQCAHWYVQLWSESLGKIDALGNRVGPTPMVANGATDQHSMLQLWREGPKDKVIGFLCVEDTDDIPLEDNSFGTPHSWLCGQSLGLLLRAEQIATEKAVSEAGQATWTLTIPTLSPFYIGQFFTLWQVAVSIAGRLMELDPYNQPGVELGKQLTRDAFR